MDPGFERVNAPPVRIKRGFTSRFRVSGICKTALEQKSIVKDNDKVLVYILSAGQTGQKQKKLQLLWIEHSTSRYRTECFDMK